MRMRSRLKTTALAGVVVAAVLVPLYGDPRPSPVTHAEWARMLLRALEMDTAIGPGAHASQVFSTLSWKNSLAFSAEQYLSADGVSVEEEGGRRRVAAVEAAGVVSYPLAVVRGGDYRFRVRIHGDPARPAGAEIAPAGEAVPTASFTIVPSPVSGWVDAGTRHLDSGAYTATVLLPRGTSLESLEVSPPCVGAVEPPGGWRPTAIAQTTDVAVTAVKALDRESELPPAATPIEILGSDFQTSGSTVTRASARTEMEKLWLSAGPGGLQAVVFVELPEAGLYTVSVFGTEAGAQSWLADSCRKAVLCGPHTAVVAERGAQWRTVMTTEFTAGRHFFTVNLANGAAVERVRLERKKDSPADYLGTLRRLGFDPGPEGPISRDRAVDAMRFIRAARTEVVAGPCGDVPPPPATVTADRGLLAEPTGPIAGPAAAPPTAGPGQPPLAPPALPPQQPASPVVP